MKALDILKAHYGNEYVFTKYTRFSQVEYEQSIAELEALQAPKTCETCKHNDGDCAVLDLLQDAFGFESDNCICPNYEPKEEK